MASWAGPDPKPAAREKASQGDWEALRDRFAHAPCVSCGEARDVSLHHVVPRSQGGDDVYENLVPLCGDGTRGCHGAIENHTHGWEKVAAAVRQWVLPHRGRCVYVIGKIGWDRFNRRYPIPPSSVNGFSPPEFGGDFQNERRKSPWELGWEPPRVGEYAE